MDDTTEEHMLTTVDNPFNPFTDYDAWLAYDRALGYDTPGMLARIANVSLDLPEHLVDQSIEEAIDEIVTENVSGNYIKASRPKAA
jgi:hypothetical protein